MWLLLVCLKGGGGLDIDSEIEPRKKSHICRDDKGIMGTENVTYRAEKHLCLTVALKTG